MTDRAAPALRSGSAHPSAAHLPTLAAPPRFLGVFAAAPDARHAVRVRKLVPLAPGLTGELGVAADLRSGEVVRHAALTYNIESKGGRPLAQLRVSSPGLVQASHAFRVRLPGASVLLRLVAGAHADGRPVFGVDIDDVSPPPLVAAAAAAALAAGKTVAGAKGMPLATLRVPGLDVPWTVGAEIRASVQKRGKGVAADLRELNFVLDV